MGQTSLREFEANLERALGERDVGERQTKKWINDGYLDLTGSFDFIELRSISTTLLAAEAEVVSVPDDLYWIRAVFNAEDDEELSKLSSEYFHRMNAVSSLSPRIRYWTRDGRGLYIRPTFTKERELTLFYNREPARMQAAADRTVIPATFDRGLELFALYHALTDLGEEARAANHRNNGILYVRSRIDPADREFAPGRHEGIKLVREKSYLRGGYRRG